MINVYPMEIVQEYLEENGIKTELHINNYRPDVVGSHILTIRGSKREWPHSELAAIQQNSIGIPQNTIVTLSLKPGADGRDRIETIANLNEPDSLEKLLEWVQTWML